MDLVFRTALPIRFDRIDPLHGSIGIECDCWHEAAFARTLCHGIVHDAIAIVVHPGDPRGTACAETQPPVIPEARKFVDDS